MSRPRELDLTAGDPGWHDVPMPGANHPFHMRRLDSTEPTFALHGRFPAGFVRDVAGGYEVAEEFVVLEGELCLGGVTLRPGDLTHVPARRVRSEMRTSVGCTVLAWFGGPALFVPEAELDKPSGDDITTVRLDRETGVLLDLPTVRWQVLDEGASAPRAGEALDLGLRAWWRLDVGDELPRAAFVRTEP